MTGPPDSIVFWLSTALQDVFKIPFALHLVSFMPSTWLDPSAFVQTEVNLRTFTWNILPPLMGLSRRSCFDGRGRHSKACSKTKQKDFWEEKKTQLKQIFMEMIISLIPCSIHMHVLHTWQIRGLPSSLVHVSVCVPANLVLKHHK